MLQFSLRNLLLAVAAVAVGTAALLNANVWWASLLFAVEVLLLFFAGIEVLFRREGQRAFWSGYLLAGGLYLLLLMHSASNTDTNSPLYYHNLGTTKALTWAYSWLPDSKTANYLPVPPSSAVGVGGMGTMPADGPSGGPGAIFGGMGGGGMSAMSMISGAPNPSYVDFYLFCHVGHVICAIFLAWLGGTFAYWRSGYHRNSSTRDTPGRA